MSGRLLNPLFAFSVIVALVAGFIWLGQAGPGLAEAAPEKKNCPAGFHWERFPSPIGCVQSQLPAHGKIGYDGYGICEDGYVGDSERRPTTDGKQAPGSPYASFPYLLGCYGAEEYAKLQAAGQLPSQTSSGSSTGSGFSSGGSRPVSDVAERLYDGGGPPSKGQLAGLAGIGLGAVTLVTWGVVAAGSPPIQGAPGAGYPREKLRQMIGTELKNEQADWEAFKKLDERYRYLDLKRFALNNRLEELHQYLDRVNGRIERAGDAGWTFFAAGVILAALLGGPVGALAGIDMGLAGQYVSLRKGDFQDLRVAARVAIERLGQKIKQFDVALDKVGLERRGALNTVKNTRERTDFLETAWKQYDYGDPGYQRARPELPGEKPFWDL
jgi:hypothetical protein